MKLTKCSNGHFYDAEKYNTCPHCSSGGSTGNGFGEDRKTDFLMSGAGMQGMDNDVTRSGGNAGYYGGDMNQPAGERVTVGINEWGGQQYAPGGGKPVQNAGGVSKISQATGDDNKTVAYMNWQNTGEDDSAQPVYRAVQQRIEQPVVGWVVCVEGSNYGNCFILFAGKNFIGRSSDMDICLAGDNTVSRVKHAIIIYEPRERKYFAQPGESHELFYLNDSVVLTSTELHDRDVITIGKTRLVFVPFCDERFGWEKS